MDLSFLIPSKVRRKVLEFFVKDPEAQVYVRELARELNLSPQVTYRELLNLVGWGMLLDMKRGNQRVFRLNQKFILFPSIVTLFKELDRENNYKYEIARTFDWNELSKKYDNIPIPKELISGLTAKRKKPRAYAEEKILKKKGLL